MKTLFKQLMLTATMLCCSILFAVAQGNFVIEGDVIIAGSGGVGKPNWPVGIRLLGTNTTDIVYTNANGHYSMVIAGGAVIGPNKCWEVSTRDTCTPGTFVYFQDTVCNNQGTVTFGVVNFEIGRSCSCGSGFQFTLNNQVASFFSSATGTAPFSYQWNFGDGSTGTGANPVHTYLPGNYRACVLVTDANGCQSDFCDSVSVSNNNQTCYSFEEQVITQNDKEHAFNLYGDGNVGFLDDWYVTNGTPSIYRDGFLSGINAYDGNQYALLGISDFAPGWSEGLSLSYNFQQGNSYTVTVAVRNQGLNGTPIPMDVDFILLHDTIPFTYQTQTGATPTPAVPSNSLTVHSITGFNQNSWQLVTFTISNLNDDYAHLWFRLAHSSGAPLETSFFLFDALCIEELNPTPNSCEAYFYINGQFSSIPAVVYFHDTSFTSSPNDPITSWHWDFGDNSFDSVQNPIHTYTTPGTYVVCLTITSLSGCTDDFCKTLTIGNNGGTCNADFTYTGIPGPTIAFTNTSNQGGVSATYRWTFGDNTSSADQNPVHAYTHPGQYRVCLVITTANGCVDDICKYVTIGSTNNCEAAFIAYPVANNRVEFSNNSVAANPNATTYKWTYGDGTASTQFAPDHIYQAPGTYTVCLFIYDQAANCRDTVCKQVIVGTSSTPTCEAAFSYTVIGSRVEFHSTSVPALNTTSHFWTFGDSTTSTQVNPQHIFANPGTYTVCLTIINSLNGCTDDVCHTIVIGSNQQQFCISGKICKGINSNNAYPAYVYLIYFDSIQGTLTAVRTTGTNQNGEYEFCNVPHGKYLVKAALSPNSPDYRNYLPTYYGNSLFWSYGIQVMLNQNRQQVDICLIAGNNNGGPGFVGGYVQQGANKTGNFAGDALVGVQVMLLDLNDNPLQYTYSDEDGRFTFDDVAYGTYKVYAEVLDKTTIPYLVTIGPEQTEKDDILLLVETAQVISGLDEQLNTTIRSLRVYPNPVSEVVYVELNLITGSDVSIAVTDITGRVIIEEILNGNSGEQIKRISMASQQAGIYFVRIIQGDLNKTIKMMKY